MSAAVIDSTSPSYGAYAVLVPPALQHLEGRFTNARNQLLFYFALFPPETKALRGVVLFLHGSGDHCRRYVFLYERLCEASFGVIAYDTVNHGASHCDSAKTRGHVRSFRHLVEDTNSFVTFAKRSIFPQIKALQFGSLTGSQSSASSQTWTPPMIISGTSFGGLLGRCNRRDGDVDGVEAAGDGDPGALLLVPKVRIVAPLDYEMLWRDPGYLEDFKADALATTEDITARTMQQTMSAMSKLMRDKRVEQPSSNLCALRILFLTGSEDHIADQDVSRQFFNRLANTDKEFKVFDGVFHCVFEDPERDEVVAYVLRWLHRPFRQSGRRVTDSTTANANCATDPTNDLRPSGPHEEARAGTRSGINRRHGAGVCDPEDLSPLTASKSSTSKSSSSSSSSLGHSRHIPPYLRPVRGQVPEPTGQSLSTTSLSSPEPMPMRGVVLCLHGIGDHCRRYIPLYERLCEKDSQLPIPRGRHQRVHHVREEIHLPRRLNTGENTTTRTTRTADTKTTWSLRTAVDHRRHVLWFANRLHTVLTGRHKFHAGIWASPTIGVTWTPLLWAESKLAVPLATLFPKARVVPAVQHELLCRDLGFLDDFAADPLTSMDMLTSRSGHESLQAMIRLQEDERVSNPDSAFCAVPMLFLAGSADGIADQQAAIKFFASMGNLDKEFKFLTASFTSCTRIQKKKTCSSTLHSGCDRDSPLRPDNKVQRNGCVLRTLGTQHLKVHVVLFCNLADDTQMWLHYVACHRHPLAKYNRSAVGFPRSVKISKH
ncbi:Alpha/Beta hydrolase fold [Phytophthora cactorum]|nr:Alpha/Beta hydrolase fold [Phytophthora cactorum]